MHSQYGTVEGWVKTKNDADTEFFTGTDASSGQDEFDVELGPSTAICTNELITVYSIVTNTEDVDCYTTTNRNELFDGKWHYIAATVSSTGINIYLDGVSKTLNVTNYRGDAGVFTQSTNINRFRIGVYPSPTNYLKGSIDQFRIYNYARTPAQVAWDYNRGGPVGYWKFDECQGATVLDHSGKGNNGTITVGGSGTDVLGTCTGSTASAWKTGVLGKYNSSLYFDGSNDYVDMSQPISLNISGDMSISAWIRPSAMGALNDVISNYNSGGTIAEYELYFTNNSGNHVDFDWGNSGNYNDWGAEGYNFGVNTWYHIVAVRIGLTAKIYINGISQPLTQRGAPGGSGTTVPTSGYGNTTIGRAGSFSGQYFSGQIDDVRVFNYALTPVQVQLLYNNNAALQVAPLTGTP